MGIVLVDLAFFRLVIPAPSPDTQFIENDLLANSETGVFLSNAGPVEEIDQSGARAADFAGFVLVDKGTLLGSDSPLVSADSYAQEDLLTYTIKEGDTLSSIAQAFGIRVGDILEANDRTGSFIKPGEELVIVPVSKSGSTIARVATEVESAPVSNTYFIRPVDGGLNWGAIHDSRYMPAVDISKACGSPIYAAARGTVIQIGSPQSYNSGYGGYVIISHPNGTRTVYAHNSQNHVEVGDFVDQGQTIASVGNSGLTYGSTGCHVHFGVTGAPNPFAK